MLFTLPLDSESSAASFLAIICQTFWMSLSARWSNACVAVVSWSLSSTWPILERSVYEAQWLTVLLSTTVHHIHFLTTCDIRYWFLHCHKKFSSSPSFKRHIAICHHFDYPLCMLGRCIVSSSAVASGTFGIYQRRKLQAFPLDFEWHIESIAKLCGNRQS